MARSEGRWPIKQAGSEECMCRVREIDTFTGSGVNEYKIETVAFQIM